MLCFNGFGGLRLGGGPYCLLVTRSMLEHAHTPKQHRVAAYNPSQHATDCNAMGAAFPKAQLNCHGRAVADLTVALYSHTIILSQCQ